MTLSWSLLKLTQLMKILILSAALAVALSPSISLAAMYAYVNTAGEVMTTDAASPDEALMRPDLHVRSGVMLVDDASDSAVVGDSVPGT